MSTIIKHKEFTNRHVYRTEVAGRWARLPLRPSRPPHFGAAPLF